MISECLSTEFFPDIEMMSMESANHYSQLIRTETRPELLALFANSLDEISINTSDIESKIEVLDNYAVQLDQYILDKFPPKPAQLWQPEFEIMDSIEHTYTYAHSPLFFSAESLTNVHGPVMLFHFAVLAQTVLYPGEEIVTLKKTQFKALVTCHLKLFIYDSEHALPKKAKEIMAEACIRGEFLLNSGRKLTFFGVQINALPVTRFANFNSLATSLLPSNMHMEVIDEVYTFRLKANPANTELPSKEMHAAVSLMTILDLWMLMMLLVPRPEKTKLLISIKELHVPLNLFDHLSSETLVEFKPLYSKARQLNSNTIMMPGEFRFSSEKDKWMGVKLALSTLPYYHFIR